MPYKNPEEKREYDRAWREANVEKRREYARDRAARNRALVEAARTSCVDCGAPSEHLHHLDPETKLFNVGGRGLSRESEARLLAEIAKTVPLCRRCHDARHTAGL